MLKSRLFFLLILLAYISFPGLIPFINDEPALILKAIANLESGQMAEIGLTGSKNIPFGPVAIWFYQLCLLITSDLLLIVQIKAALFVIIIFFSSKEICKELKLNSSLAFIPLLSPYIFHYSRILWDNCFLIPLSFLLTAIALSFWRRPAPEKLILLVIIASLMIQIHLTAALLLIPLFLLSCWKSRRWLAQNLSSVIFALAIFIALNLNYLLILTEASPINQITNTEDSWLNIFYGFKNLTAFDFYTYFIPEIFQTNHFFLIKALSYLSLFILALPLISIRISGVKLLTPYLVILTLAFPVAILAKLHDFPHYYNSLLPIYFIFFAIILSHNKYPNIQNSAICLFLATNILLFQYFILQNDGTKSTRYGATLSNQIAVFKNNDFNLNQLKTNVRNYQLFPHAAFAINQTLNKNSELNNDTAIIYQYQDIRGSITAVKLNN